MKSVIFETLDQIDRKILDELARDGRLSVAELSRRVNLSKTPCQARIKRLDATAKRLRALEKHVGFTAAEPDSPEDSSK